MGLLVYLRGCLALLLTAGLVAGGDGTARSAGYSEEEIKGAMLYNFTRFVDWPAGALGGEGAPVVIGVLGADSFIPELATVLRGKAIYGHPVAVRHIERIAGARNCAVLFIGAAGSKEIVRVLQSTAGAHVLTIGDSLEFARLGGMIAFIRDGNRIRFEVNLDAAERAGLGMSSKMLHLATVYRAGPVRAGN